MAYEADAEYPCALRWTTTDDLHAYLDRCPRPETTRLDFARQLEEAWFLGLRLNTGVDPAALEEEFGADGVAPTLRIAEGLIADALLERANGRIRLTDRGRLLSNEVFQNFLEPSTVVTPET